MASSTAPGPLVRLRGLRTEQLPAATASPDELAPFLLAILREAVPFIDSAAPKAGNGAADPKIWKLKGSHAHPDSAAKIEVLERVVLPAAELEKVAVSVGGGSSNKEKEKEKEKSKGKVRPETWCCRRSVHEDKPERGTASWDEFVRSFRDEHAESERAFTPACVDAHQALAWDCGGAEALEGGQTWGRFGLVVQEMRHRIGRPVLKDRTFPVLQMTATATAGSTTTTTTSEEGEEEEEEEFLVVSIPIPDFGTSEASKLAKEKGAQIASYVSVERIRRIEGGDRDEDGGRKVEWLMATASDAGGVLPGWVQNVAAPGVIWKDVPLFLGWIGRERVKRQQQQGRDDDDDDDDGTNNAEDVAAGNT
ncbi:hypothetical protein F5Y00DRAFT_236886 [Daldinia vernicosa]|uniref:uncharacterized protein n=1 Tax=Daldinia vernicosa TaxID=114800 RepID=UPI0020086478|nr:uncharacterized protein F5Y00DRAFT_236886 [Daldinia vernicosa]KAI0848882.1 hypothetical protein F5Y00DRAFT_236886 [Daldinia vernicosa]